MNFSKVPCTFISILSLFLLLAIDGCIKGPYFSSLNQEDILIEKTDKYQITEGYDSNSNTKYILTQIKHKDKRGKLIPLKLALTDSSETKGETASTFAKRTHSSLVFNASMGVRKKQDDGDYILYPSGLQIIDGRKIQDLQNVAKWRYTLEIKKNGELVSYDPGISPEVIIQDGIVYALTAFVPLIRNHHAVSDAQLKEYGLGNLPVKHPRQVIAQLDNMDILFLSTGGRGYGGDGMTAKEIIAVLQKMDVKFAFNLDGGGSTSVVSNGKFLNWKIDKRGSIERKRANFLYID